MPSSKLAYAATLENDPQPWLTVDPPWTGARRIPSMLTDDEMLYLSYLARNRKNSMSSLVDLGPLAGGSTQALASGIGEGGGLVHSYDLWRMCAGWEQYLPGWHFRLGDSILPAFVENINSLMSRIVIHQGDLLTQHWTGWPIEILFVDAANSPALMQHIVREFYPHMRVGGYIVHREYVSAAAPWVHIVDRTLSNFTEPVDSPCGNTVAFRVTARIPADVIPADFLNTLPLDHACELLDEAAALMAPDSCDRLRVMLAKAHHLILARRVGDASDIYQAVLNDQHLVRREAEADLKFVHGLMNAASLCVSA